MCFSTFFFLSISFSVSFASPCLIFFVLRNAFEESEKEQVTHAGTFSTPFDLTTHTQAHTEHGRKNNDQRAISFSQLLVFLLLLLELPVSLLLMRSENVVDDY
jgi:hypothetical protein